MEQEKQTDTPSAYIKMDYSLDNVEDRIAKVNEIIANTPSEKLTPLYLDKMAKYIIKLDTKKENKQEHNIKTDNQMITVNKRELSFEGLADRLENGEDGIYNMIANDKNILFTPKKGFTQDDIDSIPGLRDLVNEINAVKEEFKKAIGMRKKHLKTQIIEMQQDQYELKKMFKKPINLINTSKSMSKLNLDEEITIETDESGKESIKSTGIINLFNPKHISLLLCNYSNIKEECWDKFDSDIKWVMEDLDNLIEETLKDDFPLLYSIVIYKIDGKQNIEIQKLLMKEHNTFHTVEYISSLWRNKIPKLLSDKAAENWLIWHYTVEEKGKWKRCSACGQIKLAHSRFFSKNSSSKDGWYSLCKKCRSKKYKKII